jgi:type IV secretion system protein VirB6
MACTSVITGDRFILRTLEHIDCQAQLIGSYGYQALGDPGSDASLLMTGLLTLFIALFGVRVMFGPTPGPRDLVLGVIKIGIVLTLAFSWPAFRTLIYDVTLDGPAELSATIQSASQGEAASGLGERLQQADDGIVTFTAAGTGRNTGAFIDGAAPGGTFEGTALQDESTFGWARLAYLAGVIGSLGLLRIAAGLLLALAPLAAGMLLFEATRGLFSGWLKGLVLVLLGSLGASLVLSVELAILETWLADALRVRGLGYATPAAPTELLAITLGFALVQFALVWVMARVAFNRGWSDVQALPEWIAARTRSEDQPRLVPHYAAPMTGRAERVSAHVETALRREERGGAGPVYRTIGQAQTSPVPAAAGSIPDTSARLGSSYRRTASRRSQASRRRDSL